MAWVQWIRINNSTLGFFWFAVFCDWESPDYKLQNYSKFQIIWNHNAYQIIYRAQLEERLLQQNKSNDESLLVFHLYQY